MADRYRDWAALAAANTAGVDYRLVVRPGPRPGTAHLAIHGGAIEGGTGELALAVGAGLGQSVYVMKAVRPSGNADLHLTSTRFDEPRCVAMQAGATRTVSYHGAEGAGEDRTAPVTFLGGRDTGLRNAIGAALAAAGFTVDYTPDGSISGVEPANICNRNASGMGVQLELTSALRASFFPGGADVAANRDDGTRRTAAFHAYADAVASAVGS